MGDSAFSSCPQPLYPGCESVHDLTRRTSFMNMNLYGQTTPHEEMPFADMSQSHPTNFYHQSFFDPATLTFPTRPTYGEVDFLSTGLLPTSMNPPTSLPPSAFHNPAPTSNHAAQSPSWSSNSFNNLGSRPIPVQMPELGYESASPMSDEAPYSRIALSESPLPRIEEHDNHDSYHQAMSSEEDLDNADPCYAELLRKCLLQAPDHTMSLRDLYAWVAENSPKAKDPTSTGWKNSVRHNLSMNQGFEKVPDKNPSPSNRGSKTRSYWRLTEDAALRGIQSTTRYRKGDGKRKSQRSNRHGTPDDKRVRSGAKGGQATRRLANRRAAAAARSTWSSSRVRSHRAEPYPIPACTAPTPDASPSPTTTFPEANNPSYWTSMAEIQDPTPYATPYTTPYTAPTAFCKIETGVQDYYTPGPADYYQHPFGWSHSASPIVPIKTEGGWLGDPQETGLGLGLIY